MLDGDCVGVVEPTPIKDIFATTLAEIQIEDGFARYVLCSKQPIMGTTAHELVVVAKIVIPIDKALMMSMRSVDALTQPRGMVA